MSVWTFLITIGTAKIVHPLFVYHSLVIFHIKAIMSDLIHLHFTLYRPLEAVMDETEATIVPHIMSEQEIMHKFWKISMNVRLASVALQR